MTMEESREKSSLVQAASQPLGIVTTTLFDFSLERSVWMRHLGWLLMACMLFAIVLALGRTAWGLPQQRQGVLDSLGRSAGLHVPPLAPATAFTFTRGVSPKVAPS